MRSPQYKHHSLADLEWLVVPALLAGQFSLTTAPSNKTGSTTAVGVVLWACVSEETDRQLSGAPRHPIRLNQQDWNSGDVIWVIASVGDGRVLQEMLKRLQEKEWANKSAKVLAVAENGMPTVATIGAKAA